MPYTNVDVLYLSFFDFIWESRDLSQLLTLELQGVDKIRVSVDDEKYSNVQISPSGSRTQFLRGSRRDI